VHPYRWIVRLTKVACFSSEGLADLLSELLGELGGRLFIFGVGDSSRDIDERRGLAIGSAEGREVAALSTETWDEEGDVGNACEKLGVGVGEAHY